jgi:drug/metabolite transporter (DMT)-like permease
LWCCFGVEKSSSFLLKSSNNHYHGGCVSPKNLLTVSTSLSTTTTTTTTKVMKLRYTNNNGSIGSNNHNNKCIRGTPWALQQSTSSSSSNNNNNSNSGIISKEEQLLGTSVLLTVPLAWGTYAPAVRYMYENVSPAVPGIVFSAMYYVVACVTLLSLQYFTTDATTTTISNSSTSNNNNNNNNNRVRLAGLELGGYLFIGNWLQVTGLQTVPADRAAFLVQLTTLFVPLTQAAMMKKKLPLSTWIACILAFAGVIIMTMDDSSNTNGGMMMIASNISSGDILIVFAAMAYTLHVVRLGAYTAPSSLSDSDEDDISNNAMTINNSNTNNESMSPLALAASKATTEAILSVGVVLWYCFTASQQQGEASDSQQQVVSTYVQEQLLSLSPVVGATVLWTGWITCAYTIYAQSFGQARITSPTDANLIYSTQPIFSAIFAYFLLQEQLGTNGIIGATLIGSALYMITTATPSSANDDVSDSVA